MSEFKFSCPHCAQHIRGDERYCGKQIQCPACKHLITVPLSPAMRAAGNKTVQSGMTWDTFLPAQPKKQATDKKPPKPGKS
jgi:hypothetical protein